MKALPIAKKHTQLCRAGFVSEGLLLLFFCMTKGEKREIDDLGDSGGILLKSNTEAPGEEVVRSTLQPPLSASPLCFIASVPHSTLSFFVYFNGVSLLFPFVRRTQASLLCPLLWTR